MDNALGADLRALRRARGLTLRALAEAAGRSVGWMSQAERGLSRPTLDDLRRLAAALDVPPDALMGPEGPEAERGVVVRAGNRRPIGSRAEGLSEELLSPDLSDAFEVVRSVFAPGARLPAPAQRPTQEVGYVESGRLDLTVAGRLHRLRPGDSFRLRGEPFLWANPHAEPCTVIWVIAPPIY
jgi:transcriptional regulator with XRE-family HTH domain